jgi:hypothetical protein
MTTQFNGLDMGLGNLARLSDAKTRSISAENPTGEKGKGGMAVTGTGANAARELGLGWKVNPCLTLPKGETTVLADIEGPGAIQHIWITVHPKAWRAIILRMYWDGEETPSVEVPVGDFFCMGWCKRDNLNSLPVAVNPAGGFNCYWEMPFHKSARITVENLHNEEIPGFFFQIDYTLTEVPADKGTFHAQWRRVNPLPYGEAYTIVDGIKGKGQYVGTYMAWGSNNNGWWGEGEIKFFMDGDSEFPTICGTGTEDYFGGAWCFEFPEGEYGVYSGNYCGMPQVIKGDGLYNSQQRFGLYRWHIMDPVRFDQDLRVTMQALGWRHGGRYLLLQDDIASTCFWYQTEPHQAFPTLPPLNDLEVI